MSETELAEIDPLQFERGYWVVPDDQEGAKRAYALLRTAMEKKEQVAIGRFVLREACKQARRWPRRAEPVPPAVPTATTSPRRS